jgi:purine-nucleoside phosphorylase
VNRVLLDESIARIRQLFSGTHPSCALILGSGWGNVPAALTEKQSISYADIPCLGQTEVKGHEGRLILAEHLGRNMLIFQGRRHWYEGAGWDPIALPVYTCLQLGIHVLILTNAAGSLSDTLEPGELMIIDDHINAMGVNPLVGSHDPVWGPRFPDQSEVYDPVLRRLLDHAANQLCVTLPHGVYVAVSGPTYETPAEAAALRQMGASAVGMSTVPEAILARAAGLRVAGISCITNKVAGLSNTSVTHEEALVHAARSQPRMKALLLNLFADPAFHAVCDED